LYRFAKTKSASLVRRFDCRRAHEIYNSWREQLVSSEESFYLRFGFSSRILFRSQLSRRQENESSITKVICAGHREQKFPFEKYVHSNYDLAAFDWRLCVDEDII
jgi:hypothetical protein